MLHVMPLVWAQCDAFPQVPRVDGEGGADCPEHEPEAAPLTPLLGKSLALSVALQKKPKGIDRCEWKPLWAPF